MCQHEYTPPRLASRLGKTGKMPSRAPRPGGIKEIDPTTDPRTIPAQVKDTGKQDKPKVHSFVFSYFPRALLEVAIVGMYGAEKHGVHAEDRAFMQYPLEMFEDALARHELNECIEGPVNYADAELYHKSQRAWNALAALEIFLTEKDNA